VNFGRTTSSRRDDPLDRVDDLNEEQSVTLHTGCGPRRGRDPARGVQRLLRHEVNVAAKQVRELVLQSVDRETETPVRRQHVQQVDVAAGFRLDPNGRAERREFDDAEAVADLGKSRQLHVTIVDPNRRCGAHDISLTSTRTAALEPK
jgi:hypothetical protein